MKIAQLDVLALQLVRRGSHGSRYFCQIVRVKMLNNLLSVRPCFDGTARHPGELRAILCRYVAVSCQTTISHVLPWAFGLVSYQPAQCPRQAGIDLGPVGHICPALCDSRAAALHVLPCTFGLLSYQPWQCPRQVGIDSGVVFHIYLAVCDNRCYLSKYWWWWWWWWSPSFCSTTIWHVLPWAFGLVSYQPAQCPRQAGIDLGPVGLIEVFCRQVTSLRAFCFTARIRDNMQQNHVISLLRQACRDDIDFSLSLSLSVQGQFYMFYLALLDFCHTSLNSVHVRLV